MIRGAHPDDRRGETGSEIPGTPNLFFTDDVSERKVPACLEHRCTTL